MNDFSMWTGELGGSMSDIWAAELGVAAMAKGKCAEAGRREWEVGRVLWFGGASGNTTVHRGGCAPTKGARGYARACSRETIEIRRWLRMGADEERKGVDCHRD